MRTEPLDAGPAPALLRVSSPSSPPAESDSLLLHVRPSACYSFCAYCSRPLSVLLRLHRSVGTSLRALLSRYPCDSQQQRKDKSLRKRREMSPQQLEPPKSQNREPTRRFVAASACEYVSTCADGDSPGS